MLKNSLYTIENQFVDGDYIVYNLRFDAQHIIYKAHFPDHPITPGACLVQIIKELSELTCSVPLFLSEVKNVKFVNLISPVEETLFTVKLSIKEDVTKSLKQVSATISDEAKLYARFLMIFKFLPLCVIVPVYNNEKTVKEVVTSILPYCSKVIVVNDGSTDGTRPAIETLKDKITLIDYAANKGKGYALRCGFARARQLGFHHVLTMDADGQHQASDISAIWETAIQNPDALVIGARSFATVTMPERNRKANQFSNFWFALQTACHLTDTQSGFRIYPLDKMQNMRSLWNRYEAELDLLVRAAWCHIPLIEVPISVYYPPKEDRVSHFRPVQDFMRISVLNAGLCVAALFYGWPKMLITGLFPKFRAR